MMVLYSPDWTNTGFSFILLTVNLFRHSTLTEQGLYFIILCFINRMDPDEMPHFVQSHPSLYCL